MITFPVWGNFLLFLVANNYFMCVCVYFLSSYPWLINPDSLREPWNSSQHDQIFYQVNYAFFFFFLRLTFPEAFSVHLVFWIGCVLDLTNSYCNGTLYCAPGKSCAFFLYWILVFWFPHYLFLWFAFIIFIKHIL